MSDFDKDLKEKKLVVCFLVHCQGQDYFWLFKKELILKEFVS